ncbi:hypothetical protein BJX66DRAFT_311976 [Aspergillus keveii]|uniref:Uncharacterized protein n=1 Tax=Aspergillus keveii TaxID=714993 RepID=A0ABR4FUJ0_9EURO
MRISLRPPVPSRNDRAYLTASSQAPDLCLRWQKNVAPATATFYTYSAQPVYTKTHTG